MATFTDFEIWYHGKAPLGIMSIVRNEMTYSGLLTVGIAGGDSIHIQANRFNEEYYDEAVEELISKKKPLSAVLDDDNSLYDEADYFFGKDGLTDSLDVDDILSADLSE